MFSLTKEMDPQTFQNKYEQWDQIWSNANVIIDHYRLQAPAVRHATRSRVGRAQQSTGSDDFRRLVYIPICAAVHEELARSFLKQEHNHIYRENPLCSQHPRGFSIQLRM